MKSGRIVIVTGPPGTGKTTAAARLAEASALARSVHLHTDDFYHFLRKGAVPPHLPGSEAQNQVVIEAFAAAARRFTRGGYDVIVDGIVGPWFLGPWRAAAAAGYAVHYFVLRADLDETRRRAAGRGAQDREMVEAMWGQFQDLGPFEAHVLAVAGLTAGETVSAIQTALARQSHLLKAPEEEETPCWN